MWAIKLLLASSKSRPSQYTYPKLLAHTLDRTFWWNLYLHRGQNMRRRKTLAHRLRLREVGQRLPSLLSTLTISSKQISLDLFKMHMQFFQPPLCSISYGFVRVSLAVLLFRKEGLPDLLLNDLHAIVFIGAGVQTAARLGEEAQNGDVRLSLRFSPSVPFLVFMTVLISSQVPVKQMD